MCGIAGKVHLISRRVYPRDLKIMATKIAHRGPDDEGIYISTNRKVGLVNRRLAIIDLSSAGHQPMNYLNRYWITFNGEVYNFQQRQEELVKLGYKFHSHTDTEVILALYDKYREKCVDYLRGMWAFAIWDEKESVLFLSRDRLGKKPLKYYFNDGVFIFASELKAILTQPEVHRQPDWTAIHHYLTLGYCPAPLTGFVGIEKLEPGQWLKINLATGRLIKRRYWRLDFSPKLILSEQEWREKILAELETATRLRMVADVPVGAFLSGGVDSSSIVAMMAKNSPKPIKTFTIAFAEAEYDETAHAARIAKLFGTQHVVLLAKPHSVETLPTLAAAYEEPFADSSALVTHMVSQLARKHVKVILNGDGGDENFTGYAQHLRLARDAWLDKHPRAYKLGYPLTWFWPQARKFFSRQHLSVIQKYLGYKSIFPYNRGVLKLWTRLCREAQTPDVRDRVLYADLKTYFPDDLLAKVDIASMAVGLEARSPLTDHKLVELAARIPFDLKIKGGQTKYIFKRALAGIIPKKNLYRPKMGFSIPLAKWFTGDLKRYAASKLGQEGIIGQMLKEHSPKNDFGPKLWALLMLQLWWESYFA